MTKNQIKALELRIARNKKTSNISSEQVQKDAIDFNKSWGKSIVIKNNS